MNSVSPVIIGASPPAESSLEFAQRIYANLTLDFDGPARLLPCQAVTRIKRKLLPRPVVTRDDPGDDSNSPPRAQVGKNHPHVWVAENIKLLKIVQDKSGEGGQPEDGVNRGNGVTEADYLDPDASRKRKAGETAAVRPMKRASSIISHSISAKGKGRIIATPGLDSSSGNKDTVSDVTVKGKVLPYQPAFYD